MFEKFGEMGSWQELDELAKNLYKEGDKEALEIFCAENGLDIEDIEEAAADGVELFVTPTTAAMGRLKVEQEADKNAISVLYDAARAMLMNPHMAPMFLKKDKRLADVYQELRRMAEKNRKGNVGVACGTDRELMEIIRKYYEGSKA